MIPNSSPFVIPILDHHECEPAPKDQETNPAGLWDMVCMQTRSSDAPQTANHASLLSRRRKTKCDGVWPRCRYCSSAGVSCVWPSPPQQESIPSRGAQIETPISLPSSVAVNSPVELETAVSQTALKRCFDLFFSRHFASEFCSFDYRPDFEERYQDKPFLVHAIICLCARYLSPEEAVDGFQLSTGEEVWRRHTLIARAMAKDVSDEPSGAMPYP